MLDAGAAVLAAATLQAVIDVTPILPTANAKVTFSATGSLVAAGRSVVAWQWALTDGGGIVSGFDSATNASTASVTPTGAGQFTVALTVTDDQGHSSTASRTVLVAAVAPPPTPAPPPSSGGGGGALGAEWLAGLALGVAVLRRRRGRSR
jgi:serine protease